MSNEIVTQVRTQLNTDAMRAELMKALPSHMPKGSDERLIRITMSALQKTPKLLRCDPMTIYKAVMESAQLGLVPDGILGEAYFVPYGKTCQLIVGYRGLVSLAVRSGKVSHVFAEVVYENDDFGWEMGMFPKLVHKPALTDRGKFVAAYAVAHLIDNPNQPAFVVMNADEINKIRDNSQAYKFAESGSRERGGGKKDSTWHTAEDEMRKKTTIRRLCKNLPLSPEAIAAAVRGEYHEAGVMPGQTKSGSAWGFDKPAIDVPTDEVEVTVDEPEKPDDFNTDKMDDADRAAIEDAFPE